MVRIIKINNSKNNLHRILTKKAISKILDPRNTLKQPSCPNQHRKHRPHREFRKKAAIKTINLKNTLKQP